MLSYKEYKLLNESLYGAFNLGLRSPHSVGGIVSGSSINGTEAALEAESEEALEEARKGKKMKKKMDSEDMEPSDDDEEKKVVDSDEDEDHEDDDSDEEEKDSDEGDDEDSDDDDSEEDSDDEEEEVKEDKPMFMKKNAKKHMKKKSKKEWSEVMSDLEEILEEVGDEDALQEIKKGLETIREGFKKGHMKNHKKGCDCKLCKNKEEKEDGDDDEGLTDAQKKLPESLRKAILAKKSKKKDDGDDKKCGKMMDKKCGKYMNEDEAAWWNSVNNMLGSDPAQKNWDGGWSEVGEVEQAIRENSNLQGGGFSRMNVMTGRDGKKHEVKPGDSWESISKLYYGDEKYAKDLFKFNWEYYQKTGKNLGHMNSSNALRPGMTVFIPDENYISDRLEPIDPEADAMWQQEYTKKWNFATRAYEGVERRA